MILEIMVKKFTLIPSLPRRVVLSEEIWLIVCHWNHQKDTYRGVTLKVKGQNLWILAKPESVEKFGRRCNIARS